MTHSYASFLGGNHSTPPYVAMPTTLLVALALDVLLIFVWRVSKVPSAQK